ncbi:hypothetical protein [Achromobacter xylosoxidans]|uniref:hypothetical protein n=1 Tax=Alcaligenes xylosoxydans xylosoxydans TaxID=85698 RepID=UPI00295450AE|nr:hypothetical protein [Achromobacter xylosoxidans]
MPYIDPTGTNPGWSDQPQPGLGLTQYVDELPPPPVQVPPIVSRFQARMALRNAALYEAAVALMSHPATPVSVVEAWDSAQEFRRESENVQSMAAALGLNSEELDELFIAAAAIQA